MEEDIIEADVAAMKQELYSEGRAISTLILRRLARLMRERCGASPPPPPPRRSTEPDPIAGWGR